PVSPRKRGRRRTCYKWGLLWGLVPKTQFGDPAMDSTLQTLLQASLHSAKRVQKELADITLDPSPNCRAGPKGDNIYKWRSTILGSPVQHELFLKFSFHLNPFKPPKVTVQTRIYHCHINSQGVTCLDILKDNWSPARIISKVLLPPAAFLQAATLLIPWLEVLPLRI
uniref:UBC core domain-containing protein n=1 Tax=Gopherus evgoodei TaxID=1825980 RepID=A0A8C4YK84_9SAUR